MPGATRRFQWIAGDLHVRINNISQVHDMPPKPRKKGSEAAIAAQRAKDTIYYVDFIPRDPQLKGSNDGWRFEVVADPKVYPELIQDAIRAFEIHHKLALWKEYAVGFELNPLHYP